MFSLCVEHRPHMMILDYTLFLIEHILFHYITLYSVSRYQHL